MCFVIDTDLVDIFLYFVVHTDLKEISLSCLTEVALLKIDFNSPPEDIYKMKNKILDLFFKFITKISETILPPSINLSEERKRMNSLN